jgi:DNA-binding transcriptional MocR family regulator
MKSADKPGLLEWEPADLSLEGPRYRALVQALAHDIESGRVLDGQRLPTHRDLAIKSGLSVGTVTKAYQEAEKLGLIVSRVGQGTFVRKPRAMATPLEPVSGMLNLAVNVPQVGDEAQLIGRMLAELASNNAVMRSLQDYHPHGGILHHRHVVAESLFPPEVGLASEQVVFCNGAQHAIDIAIRSAGAVGGEILVDELTYSGFKAAAAANDVTLVPVAMDDEGMVPAALAEAVGKSSAKVVYIMPTLHSPTARTMGRQRREEIAEVIRTHDLMAIEDDVYGFFCQKPPVTLYELLPDQCFYIRSYAKIILPGFRLGVLISPQPKVELTNLLLHASSWFVTPLMTELIVQLIQTGTLDELAANRREQAKARYAVFTSVFPEAQRIADPAFFGWLPLGRDWTAGRFAEALRLNNILATPPTSSTVSPKNPGGVRICLGGAETLDDLRAVLHRVRRVFDSKDSGVYSVA